MTPEETNVLDTAAKLRAETANPFAHTGLGRMSPQEKAAILTAADAIVASNAAVVAAETQGA